jgi:hypothetical protein
MPFTRFERFRFLNQSPRRADAVQGQGTAPAGGTTDPVLLNSVNPGTVDQDETAVPAGSDGKSTRVQVDFTFNPTPGNAANVTAVSLAYDAPGIPVAVPLAAPPLYFGEASAEFFEVGGAYFVRLFAIFNDDSVYAYPPVQVV